MRLPTLHKLLSNQQGLSLIEVMMVLVIIGFIVLLVVNLPSSIGLIGKSRYSSIAREIASKKIENLRAQGYTSLVLGVHGFSDVNLTQLPSSTGEYTIENCSIELCSNDENIKKVIVSVKWHESDGDQEVRLQTLIAEGGL